MHVNAQAEALATSAASDLDLQRAPACRALVSLAGASIQGEAQAQKKQLAEFEYVRTSAGALNANGVKMLFFAALSGWNPGNGQGILDVRYVNR